MSHRATEMSSDEKRRLLGQMLQKRAREAVSVSPLSHGQRALWFVHQLDPDSSAYNILYAARVRADVDRPALQRALQQLVDRHAALRTSYGAQEGVPVARTHAHLALELETIDATPWSEAELQRRIGAAADRPFDLENGPVIRGQFFERAGDSHVLLITATHIALDFWSIDLIFDELAVLYREQVSGKIASLWPSQVQYGDFVTWQEQMLEGPEGQRLWDYWREHLSGPLPALDLPTDRPRPAVQTYRGDSRRFELPDELTLKLTALSKAEGATLYMTLLAAFQTLLFRYSGQPEILVGSSTAGRNKAEWEDTVGYFLNIIPIRAKLSPEMTFQDFLAQVRQTVLGGLDHQDFPFPVLVERLAPPRDVSRSPIFQVAFNWDRPRKAAPAASADGDDLGLAPFAIAQQGSAFDLTLVLMHRGDSISGAWQFNTDLFDDATIARLSGHFQTLLEGLASNPHQKLADLPLLARTERQMVVEDWNETSADFPREQCLHELISTQAAATPEKVAAAQGAHSLTYRELEERSNRLARYLQKQGVGPDSLVGICIQRSPEMLVGLLGILKAGGAYVPLAQGTPAERLAYMLQESRAQVVLTERQLAGNLPEYGGTVVLLDGDRPAIAQESSAPVPRSAAPQNLAYVIFTSGSTGKPKGVEIEHRAVVNFLTSMRRQPGIGPEDKLLAVTTLSFDISGLELFLPLLVGGQVLIASRDVAADGKQLAQLLASSGVTIMQATPATWRLLIQAGWAGDPRLKVLCGGEALPRDLANLLLARCGSLWNMYGPTETTIWSSVDRIVPGNGPVLIGPPIANTQFYILDERMTPTPIGVPGELHIGGDGLARGYLNRPDLTADRFRSDPFRPAAGRRIYGTGDLARFRPDGRIEFLGRLDTQVKVRGFRIELGEIETVLGQHPAIRDVVVSARQMSSKADDKQLVAYIVPADGQTPNPSELREFLKQKLPDYMVPAHYMSLARLPLNPAGKIDRKSLPAPEAVRLDQAEYVAPRDEQEAALAEIWASVLGVDQVGVEDDYFDLGGASMQSLEIAARAEAEHIKFTPAFLFQHPTIAQLVEALRAKAPAPEAANGHPATRATDRESAETQPAASSKPQTAPVPEPVEEVETQIGNTTIESLGVYLPPNEVTTDEVVRGCKNRVWFPLERMAGIHARRMSGEGDYCLDLARKSIEQCLAYSKYDADDIDLLICCHIGRGLGPVLIAIEPNTSLRLKSIFGFKNAVAFDITNACGGMFTGMTIADAMLSSGAIRRALVVSGEYITGITRTAQLEINGFLDPRIACLTVGDAGAAVLLESASGKEVGFHELELYTVSKYNRMCIGRLTEQPHGGMIMHVPDPIKHTSISGEHSVMHAQYMFEKKSPWPPDQIQQLIIHQTSRRSLRDGMRAINKAFGGKVSRDDNTIDNLSHRGNTASTSHMVAVWDQILAGRIKSGDRTVFAVSGSGQVIGTGLYTFDDLPDRLRNYQASGIPTAKVVASPRRPRRVAGPRVAVGGVGTALLASGLPRDTTTICCSAAEECLAAWGGDRNDIDLLIFAGLTRSEHISEPAIATFVAGELKINDCIESGHDRKTLAFDVYNGAVGLFNACEAAAGMIQSGNHKRALIVAAELEINEHFPELPLGLVEGGSAIILESASDARTGFGSFAWHYATEHDQDRTIVGRYRHGRPLYDLQTSPALEQHYLDGVPAAVETLLAKEGLTIDQIGLVLPPQFSSAFNARLAQVLGVPAAKVIDLGANGQDYFTSALPFTLRRVRETNRAKPGDIGLIVQVGSGLQIGCATYYF